MLELLLCASLTILPDYLFRRYVQGKRIGREITLRWYAPPRRRSPATRNGPPPLTAPSARADCVLPDQSAGSLGGQGLV